MPCDARDNADGEDGEDDEDEDSSSGSMCPDATLQMLSLPRGGSGKHTSETATGTSSSDGDGHMGQARPPPWRGGG